jgi:hypothetical protein
MVVGERATTSLAHRHGFSDPGPENPQDCPEKFSGMDDLCQSRMNRFLVVLRGLDPAIHAPASNRIIAAEGVDHRNKSGDDDYGWRQPAVSQPNCLNRTAVAQGRPRRNLGGDFPPVVSRDSTPRESGAHALENCLIRQGYCAAGGTHGGTWHNRRRNARVDRALQPTGEVLLQICCRWRREKQSVQVLVVRQRSRRRYLQIRDHELPRRRGVH